MISRIWIGVAAALLLPMGSVAQTVAPPDYAAQGKAFVQQLAAHDFAGAAKQFDARMAAALPSKKLSALWTQLEAQAGAFQSIQGATTRTVAGSHLAVVTCQFAKAVLDAQLAFDGDNKIAGLFFRPAAPAAAVTWSPPGYADPASFHEQPVTLRDHGFDLPGTLTLPNAARADAPVPGIVLVSGSGPNDEDETVGADKPFKDLAWGLASRGIAVLRYPKRTLVYGMKAAPDAANFTVRDEYTEDAEAAVAWLAAQPEVRRGSVFLLGHSEGAYLAPRMAAADPDIGGIVVMAGPTRPLEQLVIEQMKYLAPLQGADAATTATMVTRAETDAAQIESPDLKPGMATHLAGAGVPASYWLDLRGYQPAAVTARLKIPVLILQGARDYQVRLADYDGWKQALSGDPRATFHLYPGLTHLFTPSTTPGDGPGTPSDYAQPSHVAPEVIAGIANWVRAANPIPRP